jgi:hypothetical protein
MDGYGGTILELKEKRYRNITQTVTSMSELAALNLISMALKEGL